MTAPAFSFSVKNSTNMTGVKLRKSKCLLEQIIEIGQVRNNISLKIFQLLH